MSSTQAQPGSSPSSEGDFSRYGSKKPDRPRNHWGGMGYTDPRPWWDQVPVQSGQDEKKTPNSNTSAH